jgi:hypothetical protein
MALVVLALVQRKTGPLPRPLGNALQKHAVRVVDGQVVSNEADVA